MQPARARQQRSRPPHGDKPNPDTHPQINRAGDEACAVHEIGAEGRRAEGWKLSNTGRTQGEEAEKAPHAIAAEGHARCFHTN